MASDLLARPTEDLDLFAATPTTSVTKAKDAFVRALQERDHAVLIVQDAPTFCRLVVERAGEEALVDLAIDSPPRSRPTVTVLGPTLAPLELAGRKLLALFGRAEARDFADVYVLAQRFGKDALIKQAKELDAGFDLGVLAQMVRTIGRFDDDEIPLAPEVLPLARTFFTDWANEIG
ncbi:nucleotidyl transferase AbiEii/AbiGii toxin family protein [Occultella kanbiaonis]|uniref:nucleotidyl transferase AbiEii/AbiGii toxin family protein n=1 Tax=Occultella kanbiaonis TaxID=2675754 RepID=UPI0013D3785E|nr:nucleotidyl transferase AbiEii/AbiGii toxin family protein [Occultella kanbiaonis]